MGLRWRQHSSTHSAWRYPILSSVRSSPRRADRVSRTVAPLVDVGALILVPRRHVLLGFMCGHPADNTFSSITGPLSRDPRFRALDAEFPGSNLEEGRIDLAADDYTEELMIAGATDSRFVPSTLLKRGAIRGVLGSRARRAEPG